MKQARSILASLVLFALLAGLTFVLPSMSFASDADADFVADVLEPASAEPDATEPKLLDVEYIDEFCVKRAAQNCILLEAKTTELKEGWYVVRDNVELKNTLTLEGNVRVVLQNGSTLTATKGIVAKKDATLTVYGQQDATGKLVVHKGIKLKLTNEQKAEEREALKRELELNPNYKAPEPQLLFVQPCLNVVAGDRAPKPEDNEPPVDEAAAKEREAHAPREVAAPKLDQQLLAKKYLVIRPITKHSLHMDGDFLVIEDGHFTCTVCDGWFEDEECHCIVVKPEPDAASDVAADVASATAVAEQESAQGTTQEPMLSTLSAGSEDESSSELSNGTSAQNSSTESGPTLSPETEETADGAESNKTVTVTFDANGGSGTMESMEVVAGQSFTLPECTFDPPEGMEFSTWSLGKPGSTVSIPASITVKAWWKQASSSGESGDSGSGGQSSSDTGNSGIQPSDGTPSSSTGDSGSSSTQSGSTATQLNSPTTQSNSGSTNTSSGSNTSTSGSSSQSSAASKHPATGDSAAPYGVALACIMVGATLVLVGKVQA